MRFNSLKMDNVFKYINFLIQTCLTDEYVDDEEMAVREEKAKEIKEQELKEKEEHCREDHWSAPSKSFPWGCLFGASKLQAVRYQEYYEAAYGLIDFITDMIYFDSVLGVKVSNNDSGDAMKAFLFISSILGVILSTAAFGLACEHNDEYMKYLGVYETKTATNGIVWLRSILEDTPQVIISLVIDHYRIQQGEIERISNFGALNIAFSLSSILTSNWKVVRAQKKDNDFCEAGCTLLFFGLFNFVPCIITACVLFA